MALDQRRPAPPGDVAIWAGHGEDADDAPFNKRSHTVLRRAAPGSLEQAVLEVLWDHGGWLTPGEVHDRLDGAHPLGYTTVMTVLVRLWRKGRLERQKTGRAFAYRPSASREQSVAERMEAILAAAADRPTALGHFVERLDAAERAQLQRLLGARRKP